jgi:hypothetical protein
MKSKGLQKIVFSKYQNGDGLKIHRDLSGGLSSNTVKIWWKTIKEYTVKTKVA